MINIVNNEISILSEFIIMIIFIQIIHIIYDKVTLFICGNNNKIIPNCKSKYLYQQVPPSFEKAINLDNVPLDIIKKRMKALETLCIKLTKFDYGKVNEIHSTDPKLNLSPSMYTPRKFSSILRKYNFFVPHMFTKYNENEGCKLHDINDNILFDLDSGCAVNIIGNKKMNELINMKGGKNNSHNVNMYCAGVCSVATKNAINNVLKIYKNENYDFDCVSFMDSGSTAVASVVKQCRFYHYNSGNGKRNKIIFFNNAYHGWIHYPYNNDFNVDANLIILNTLCGNAIKYIIQNNKQIAAIFIDPMNVFAINKSYPFEGNGKRISTYPILFKQHTEWMRKINNICSKYDILFVLDECYSGFRIGPYGATITYDLKPDIIILSKQIGCGFNTSVIVSKTNIMKRSKDDLSLNVFVTGTGTTNSNHHNLVSKFVEYTLSEKYLKIHQNKMKMFQNWCNDINLKFSENNLPFQLNNYYNVFTLNILIDSQYSWIFVWKLISNNLIFKWCGTAKFTLSFDYNEKHLNELTNIFINCAKEMTTDGWFYQNNDKTIKKPNSNQNIILHNAKVYIDIFLNMIQIQMKKESNNSWFSLLHILISYPLWLTSYKFESMMSFLLFLSLKQKYYLLSFILIIIIPIAINWIIIKQIFVEIGLLLFIHKATKIARNYGKLHGIAWCLKIFAQPFVDLYYSVF